MTRIINRRNWALCQAHRASGLSLAWSALGLGAQPAQTSQPTRTTTPNAALPPAKPPMRVGRERPIQTLAEAARRARAGQVIEVDAGVYSADVAVWEHDDITLRAVGGRVRLLAQGAAAESKGIWVVRALRMLVQGFDFEGCAVPSRNGAGIRFERGSLWVQDCTFMHNEMGLLTNNEANAVLRVENCEFAHNKRSDGHNHNLYVGRIARLNVSGSYFHHATVGHLLKSRAAYSGIFYNRLTDERGGSASYELEFPNGGISLVVGNLIEQGQQTDNLQMVSVGAEGYTWPRTEVYLAHNTLVNLLPGRGEFLRVMPGAQVVRVVNNLLVGHGALPTGNANEIQNNFTADATEFANLAAYEVQLKTSSALVGRAVDAGQVHGQSLNPTREYAHPRATRPIQTVTPSTHNPGAMQSLA